MTQLAHKITSVETTNYKKQDPNSLFIQRDNGSFEPNMDAIVEALYEHSEDIKSHTMVPTPTHRAPAPHTMQLWDELNKEWIPFNLIIANSMLTRNHTKPIVRIFMDNEWKNYDNTFLVNFLKEGKFDEYDDYLYGSFPPKHYIIDFDIEKGTRTIQTAGNATPRGYVLIEGMEGNYFINPEHLDWLLIDHYEKERKQVNE